MSFKRLMFLTSSLATAGLAGFPQTADANGMVHGGTWGKPLNAGPGGNGLDCDLQLPQVQHPQAVGPVAVPQVQNNFGTRSSAGFNVARPQGVPGNYSAQGNQAGQASRPS